MFGEMATRKPEVKVTKDSTIILTKSHNPKRISAEVVRSAQVPAKSVVPSQRAVDGLSPVRRRSLVSSEENSLNPPKSAAKKVKKRQCACCGSQLGRFFHTGAPCPSCGRKICSNCRVRVYLDLRKKSWLCTQCVEERQLPTATGDWTLRKRSLLMRAPVSLIPTDQQTQTLHRHLKGSSNLLRHTPTFTETLPRHITNVKFEDQFYTATRGRPVVTSAILGGKLKKVPLTETTEVSFALDLSTKSRSNMDLYNTSRGNQISTLERLRGIKMGISSMGMGNRTPQKVKSPVLKEKYIHVSIESKPKVNGRNGISFSPDVDHVKNLPSMNGVLSPRPTSENIKSATLDRFYQHRRHDIFAKDHATEPNPMPEPGPDLTESAATLPRANRKVKRDESLLSNSSNNIRTTQIESLSLLNIAQKSGLETLTRSQQELKKNATHPAGICHPSFAVDRTIFSRQSFHRKSVMGRGSFRTSVRTQHPLDRDIWDAITMDYDEFLTVIKVNLQKIAEYHLEQSRVSQKTPAKWQDPIHVSIIEIKPVEEPHTFSRSPSLRKSKNQFRVVETAPKEVHLALQEVNGVKEPSVYQNGIMMHAKEFHVSSFVPEKEDIPEIEKNEKKLIETLKPNPDFLNFKEMPKVNKDVAAEVRKIAPLEVDQEKVQESEKRQKLTTPSALLAANLKEHKQNEIPLIKEKIPLLTSSREPSPLPHENGSFEKPVPEKTVFVRSPIPKLRQIPNSSAPLRRTESPEVPEFMKVLQRLKETKRSEPTIPIIRAVEEDEVEKLESSFNNLKKMNKEVGELKNFLKTIRQNSALPEKSPPPVPKIRTSIQQYELRLNEVKENGLNPIPTFQISSAEVSTESHMKATALSSEELRENSQIAKSYTIQVSLAENIGFQKAHQPIESSEIPAETGEDRLSDTEEPLPAKKCTPISRPLSEQRLSDVEDQDESESSDEEPKSIQACRKAENDAMLEDPEDVELWELDPQPIPYDYFGRLQVPLFTIEEESEDDEDRETAFTRTVNKRMKPVETLEFSDDEDGDLNGWESGDEEDNGQSDLEKYFMDGISQTTVKKAFVHEGLKLNELEDEGTAEPEEPSIFKSARLRFASSDYRLSSDNDMDDLSASGPSDDESFY